MILGLVIIYAGIRRWTLSSFIALWAFAVIFQIYKLSSLPASTVDLIIAIAETIAITTAICISLYTLGYGLQWTWKKLRQDRGTSTATP